MARVRKVGRAAFGDRANWTAETHREVARAIRNFTAIANRVGVDPKAPTEEWFARIILEKRAEKGRKLARRFSRAIGHYFREIGCEDFTNGPLVRRALMAGDDVDPLAIDIFDESVPLGRAQAFADSQYAEGTYRRYAHYATQWVVWCKHLGIDPLRPPVAELERWFDKLAFSKSFSTVNNARNAIAHYFRYRGVEDLSRTPGVNRILEGLRRMKPAREVRPVTPEERRRILALMPQEGTGVRDRVIVLSTAFARFGVEDISLLRAEHIRISDEGVVIDRGEAIPVVFVGAHDEQDLDIVFWMRKHFERIPDVGPLFRVLPPNMHEYAEYAMTAMNIHKIVARAATKAGVPARDIAKRLRMLFEAEIATAGVSDVVRAKANGQLHVPNGKSEGYRRQAMAMRSARRASPLGAIQ